MSFGLRRLHSIGLLSGDRLALRDAGEAEFMDLFRDLTDDKRATVCEIAKAFRPKDAA